MIKKFGVKPVPSKKRKASEVKKEKSEKSEKSERSEKEEKKTKGRASKKKESKVKDEAADDEDEDDDEPAAKKQRKKSTAVCEANQALADAFAELSGFEFKRGEKFKGGTWSKVAKAIRESELDIESGKQALKLKGVGKSSAAKIDEFLETGTLEKLEEYRAGNL